MDFVVKDIGNFLNSRTELDTNWRLRTERYIRGIAATFTQYVNTWHKVYTSRNAEKMKKNSIALSEVINDLSDQLKKMGYNDFDPEEKDIIVDNPKEFLELIPSIKKIFLNIHQL
ncbi:uncharacterized protein [Apostichopus japonicus]|uniref:uncharacterized protein n=1 Tax=Stichopus japonicus TaxID=307972 RepID=UPI003AB3EF38